MRSRGWCQRHYLRWYRYGDPAGGWGDRLPMPDRFWANVAVGESDECWEWKGPVRRPKGYGAFRRPDGVQGNAHRFAWELTHGPILGGLFACHSCDNRLCCNPAHLWLGTHLQNMADMRAKGRSKKSCHRKTEATRGEARAAHSTAP